MRPSLFLLLLLCPCVIPAQGVAPFEKQQLETKYYAEGIAAGDFDKDGKPDIVSGPFWWRGPEFTTRHTIYKGRSWPIGTYSDSFFSFALDVNADGWDDVVAIGAPGNKAQWFENPKKTGVLWQSHTLAGVVGTESPTFAQIVPGGLPELVGAGGNKTSQLGYWTQDTSGATKPWKFHPVFSGTTPLIFLHGLGVGDVNGDGRNDLVTLFGWFEQPKSLSGDPAWKWHLYRFGGQTAGGGAQMHVYDVDGDKDNDIVSSANAHGYGLSWFENKLVNGQVTFTEHVILKKAKTTSGIQFSQLHAVDCVDVDGDGLRDIVTGKAFWAHNGNDPGAKDPAVLYWFRLTRTGSNVAFTPIRIDANSGVGRQIAVRDVDGDGRADVLSSNKKGVSLFRHKRLWSDVDQLSRAKAGTQQLWLDAGKTNANRLFWIVGTASGTKPGVRLGGVHLPLNPDLYTNLSIGAVNTAVLKNFRARLDANGRARASFNIPQNPPTIPQVTLHHAFAVFDSNGNFVLTSNATVLRLF